MPAYGVLSIFVTTATLYLLAINVSTPYLQRQSYVLSLDNHQILAEACRQSVVLVCMLVWAGVSPCCLGAACQCISNAPDLSEAKKQLLSPFT